MSGKMRKCVKRTDDVKQNEICFTERVTNLTSHSEGSHTTVLIFVTSLCFSHQKMLFKLTEEACLWFVSTWTDPSHLARLDLASFNMMSRKLLFALFDKCVLPKFSVSCYPPTL